MKYYTAVLIYVCVHEHVDKYIPTCTH